MKEIISIHVGGAGMNIGAAFWEMMAREHNISADGLVKGEEDGYINKFFYEKKDNSSLMARALFMDTDCCETNKIKKSDIKGIISAQSVCTGKEESGACWARMSYSSFSSLYHDSGFYDYLRKQAESCEKLDGFILTFSFGGGTGSGMMSKMYDRLSVDYGGKTSFVSLGVYPSSAIHNSIIEPYNSLLHLNDEIEHGSLSLVVDNEALYKIYQNKLDVDNPAYSNINRLIAKSLGDTLLPIRYSTTSNQGSLNKLATSLVPYPRAHFVKLSLAPLLPVEESDKGTSNVAQITDDLFSTGNALNSYSSETPIDSYISASINYRGDILPTEAQEACACIKDEKEYDAPYKFVDYSPDGVTYSITPSFSNRGSKGRGWNDLPPDWACVNRSASMTANSLGSVGFIGPLQKRFNKLWAKRAYIHHFTEVGCSNTEFNESIDNVNALKEDYFEIMAPTAEGEPEDIED